MCVHLHTYDYNYTLLLKKLEMRFPTTRLHLLLNTVYSEI